MQHSLLKTIPRSIAFTDLRTKKRILLWPCKVLKDSASICAFNFILFRGRPGVLRFMGSQSRTRLSDWTELNWTDAAFCVLLQGLLSSPPTCHNPSCLWTFVHAVYPDCLSLLNLYLSFRSQLKCHHPWLSFLGTVALFIYPCCTMYLSFLNT